MTRLRRLLTWKWLGRATVVAACLAALLVVGYPAYLRWHGNTALERIVAQLDRDEPGWRYEEIARAHNASLPPADRNPLVLAEAAHAALPAGVVNWNRPSPDWDKLLSNVPDAASRAKLVALLQGTEPALVLARGLADLPAEGGERLDPNAPAPSLNARSTTVRCLAAPLRADAYLHAEAGRPAEAVRSVRAMLGLARAVGSHPSWGNQTLRAADACQAARAAERVINRGDADDGLAELQADFLHEAGTPKLPLALQATRAFEFQLFQSIRHNGLPPGMTVNPLEEKVQRVHMAEDLARGLDLYTRHIRAAELPPALRKVARGDISATGGGRATLPLLGTRTLFTSGQTKTAEFLETTLTLRQGELTAASVAVACERHRRRSGRWPDALADIPRDILAAVPADPADGQPIRYKRLPDGVVVYSVGPDGVDDGGLIDVATPNAPRDYGVRLYDAALRGRPAPAPVTPPGDSP